MDTLLIVGTDSTVGANLAAALSGRYRVTSVGLSQMAPIAGTDSIACQSDSMESVRQTIATIQPQHILLCGAASESSWSDSVGHMNAQWESRVARNWAAAASESGSSLTLVSSDAVFTGPWMFHEEDSECFCTSRAATDIRAIENEVQRVCPSVLVLRTNAFGWSPDSDGWIESLIGGIEAGRSNRDYSR